jgi:hypothetical protein
MESPQSRKFTSFRTLLVNFMVESEGIGYNPNPNPPPLNPQPLLGACNCSTVRCVSEVLGHGCCAPVLGRPVIVTTAGLYSLLSLLVCCVLLSGALDASFWLSMCTDTSGLLCGLCAVLSL